MLDIIPIKIKGETLTELPHDLFILPNALEVYLASVASMQFNGIEVIINLDFTMLHQGYIKL